MNYLQVVQEIVRTPTQVILIRQQQQWRLDLGHLCLNRLGHHHGRPLQRKVTAPPWLTRYLDVAPEQTRQLPADGQAQTCAAILARDRLIGLHKWLKQAGDLAAIHADPTVTHTQSQRGILARTGLTTEVQESSLGL